MYGKITVLELDNANTPQPPSGLEYGISLSLTIQPAVQQLSNVFSPLADGTYYIWWRETGASWSEDQTVKEVVLCAALANVQSLIQNYFDTIVWPAIEATQETASAAVQDLDTHNFIANNTSVGNINAINSSENYSYLNLTKVVAVFVNGVFTPWKNTVPSSPENIHIYNNAGVIKWNAAKAGFELSSADIISIVVVV